MFGKKKNKNIANDVEITEDDLNSEGEDKVIEDNSLEDDFETEKEKEVRTKKEEKAEKKPADFECACNTCPSQEVCKAAQEAEKAAAANEVLG